MNLIFSKIIDYYALNPINGFHRNKSRESQYTYLPTHTPKLKKDNILLISAKHDQYVHIGDADYLWESWERPTRYIYNCGHAGIVLNRKRIATDTFSFLQNKIKG